MGSRPVVLGHDDVGWSIVLECDVVAAPSLEEAVRRAQDVRTAERPAHRSP